MKQRNQILFDGYYEYAFVLKIKKKQRNKKAKKDRKKERNKQRNKQTHTKTRSLKAMSIYSVN